jgi:hypothetical protein
MIRRKGDTLYLSRRDTDGEILELGYLVIRGDSLFTDSDEYRLYLRSRQK